MHPTGTRLRLAAAVATAIVSSTAASTTAAVADDGMSHAVSIEGIDYSEGEAPDETGDPEAEGRWELNLVIPEGCQEPLPVFIDNPGSAWMSTDTNATSHPITAYCYAFAGVNDSASSLCRFPCQTHDMNAAIRWLRAHADGWTDPADGTEYEWSLDPNRIAASGFSSGGWQAAFEGTTNGSGWNGNDADFSWELPDGTVYEVDLEGTIGRWEGIHSSDVQAVIPLHPPTDFSLMDPPHHGTGPPSALVHNAPNSPESNLVGCTVGTSRDDNPGYTYDPACEAKVQSANPIHYVSHDDPPQMIFHGSSDSLVPHGQSVYLYEALRDGCNDVRFYSMDGHNHAPVYMNFPVSSPYVWFQATNCGDEHIAPGPPEESPVPGGTPYARYPATWEGVAAFLDEHLRETEPPDLRVDASGNPASADDVAANGYVTVEVETNEASWYDAVALLGGVELGRTSVPIYEWGAGAPAGQPAPYATTIRIPLSETSLVASGGQVVVRVTARDRVMNRTTVEDAVDLSAATAPEPTTAPTTTTQDAEEARALPATGGGAAVLATLLVGTAFIVRRRG